MRRKISILLVGILMLIVLTGCKSEWFEGEVCELEFKEACTTTRVIPITVFNGKTCSVIIVPYVFHYPDRWRVKVWEYDEENRQITYHECYVTEEVFNSLEIGDWFVYDESYCFANEPYIKERA